MRYTRDRSCDRRSPERPATRWAEYRKIDFIIQRGGRVVGVQSRCSSVIRPLHAYRAATHHAKCCPLICLTYGCASPVHPRRRLVLSQLVPAAFPSLSSRTTSTYLFNQTCQMREICDNSTGLFCNGVACEANLIIMSTTTHAGLIIAYASTPRTQFQFTTSPMYVEGLLLVLRCLEPDV